MLLIGLILFIKFSPFLFAQKKSQFLAFNSQSVGDMEAIIIRDTEHNDYNELMPQTLFRILYSFKTCHLMEQQVDKLYTVCSNVKVEKNLMDVLILYWLLVKVITSTIRIYMVIISIPPPTKCGITKMET